MGCNNSTPASDLASSGASDPNASSQQFDGLERKSQNVEGGADGKNRNATANKKYATSNTASSSSSAPPSSLPLLHNDIVFSLCSGSDSSFFSSGEDRVLVRFDSKKGQVGESVQKAHEKAVQDMCMRGEHVWTASRDRTIKQWSVGAASSPSSISLIHTYANGHTLPVSCVDISPNGSTLISGSRDYHLNFWDVSTGRLQYFTEIQQNVITDCQWIDDSCVLQASEDLSLRVWDARTRQVVQEFSDGPYFALTCDISPDSNYFLTGHNGFEGVGCEMKLFDRRMQKKVVEVQVGRQAVTDVKFIRHNVGDEMIVVSASKDASIKVWNLNEIMNAGESVALSDTQTEVGLLASQYLDQSESIQSLAVATSSSQIASGHVNGRVSVWELEPERKTLQLRMHTQGASQD